MKIVSIIGARPQFIKASVLSKEIRKHFTEILVHTGQHYDFNMSEVFFEEMSISEPDYNLGIQESTHATQTANMMIGIENILLKEKPDIALVYGDTNSTLAGALTASKLNIQVAHVEAGPRTYDMTVPEEINRKLTDRISSLLFAPTEHCVSNLKREGIVEGVHNTGDVMFDSFLVFSPLVDKSDILEKIGVSKKDYILATIHRQVNTDKKENLCSIIEAFISTKENIVFPLHPRTKKYLKLYNLYEKIKNSNLMLIDPVSYIESLALQKHAKKIVTDSGGIQKEAFFNKVPCITLDSVSAWPETVEAGWNIAVGHDKNKILDTINSFQPRKIQKSIFGAGRASEKIANILSKY